MSLVTTAILLQMASAVLVIHHTPATLPVNCMQHASHNSWSSVALRYGVAFNWIVKPSS
jgi:hypothetical protein